MVRPNDGPTNGEEWHTPGKDRFVSKKGDELHKPGVAFKTLDLLPPNKDFARPKKRTRLDQI